MRFAPIVAAVIFAAPAIAHDGDHDADDSYDSRSQVTIATQGDKRIIDANGLPDHKPGEFPNRGNPNSISAQHYHLEMPLKPHAADEPIPVRRYLFGVAVNGVVFDPGTAEVWVPGEKIVSRPGPGTRMQPGLDRSRVWNYEGMGRMNLGIDSSHAHVQPTGAYHYHGLPTGLVERLHNHVDESLRDSNSRLGETRPRGDQSMLLIGYAADGYPVYVEYGHEKAGDANSPLKKLRPSYQMKKGKRPTGDDGPGGTYDGTFVQDYEFIAGSGDLDKCNGREGVTPEYPAGTYYYVVTDTFPFIPRDFHGEPDRSFEKQLGPPLGSHRGGPRP